MSVIIAAFNAEGQITRALDSAFAQTGVSLEVVVADDASQDDTLKVARAYSTGRAKVLRLDQNGGPSAARNAAMAHAQGAWLAVLDADDIMEPGRLVELVRMAEANGADVIADNMTVQTGSARKLFIPERLDGSLEPINLAAFAWNNRLFGSGRAYGYLKPVFRRSTLESHRLQYDVSLRVGEDYQLVADLLVRGAVYLRRRSAGYVYNVHQGSISHRLAVPAAEAMVQADRRFLARHGSGLNRPTRRAVRAHLQSLEDGAAYLGALEHLKHGRLPRALASLARHPMSVRHLQMALAARLSRLGRSG